MRGAGVRLPLSGPPPPRETGYFERVSARPPIVKRFQARQSVEFFEGTTQNPTSFTTRFSATEKADLKKEPPFPLPAGRQSRGIEGTSRRAGSNFSRSVVLSLLLAPRSPPPQLKQNSFPNGQSSRTIRRRIKSVTNTAQNHHRGRDCSLELPQDRKKAAGTQATSGARPWDSPSQLKEVLVNLKENVAEGRPFRFS